MSDQPRTRTRRITGSYALGRVKTKELPKKRTRVEITMEDLEGIAAFFQELASLAQHSKTKKIAITVEEIE